MRYGASTYLSGSTSLGGMRITRLNIDQILNSNYIHRHKVNLSSADSDDFIKTEIPQGSDTAWSKSSNKSRGSTSSPSMFSSQLMPTINTSSCIPGSHSSSSSSKEIAST